MHAPMHVVWPFGHARNFPAGHASHLPAVSGPHPLCWKPGLQMLVSQSLHCVPAFSFMYVPGAFGCVVLEHTWHAVEP